MKVKNGFAILFWLVSIISLAQPAVPILDETRQHIFSFNEIEYFEDPNGKITLADVLTPAVQAQFKPSVKFNPDKVMNALKDGNGNSLGYALDEDRLIWPIPQAERDKNDKLTQNEAY